MPSSSAPTSEIPFIAKVIRNGDVDTVVHAAAASYAPRSGGRAALKEINVMGAMQLFAACQKAPSVRRVVLKSTSEVYGSSPHDPVDVHRGQQPAVGPSGGGFAQDSLDIEGYARGLGRRRPDIAVTILRLANMIGPAMDTALSRYLAGPAGADGARPRRAAAVAARAGRARRAGARHDGGQGRHVQRRRRRHHHDVAGDPAGRPDSACRCRVSGSGRSIRCGGPTRYTEINRDQLDYLSYGRVMDTTRMRTELGYQPKWTTVEAFDDYVRGRGLTPDYRPAMGTLLGRVAPSP